jgi:hypothetical protein
MGLNKLRLLLGSFVISCVLLITFGAGYSLCIAKNSPSKFLPLLQDVPPMVKPQDKSLAKTVITDKRLGLLPDTPAPVAPPNDAAKYLAEISAGAGGHPWVATGTPTLSMDDILARRAPAQIYDNEIWKAANERSFWDYDIVRAILMLFVIGIVLLLLKIFMKKHIEPITIIKVIAVLVLFGGLADNPYFYYQIQRWFICGLTSYCAYKAYEKHNISWAWIFGVIAVLFNPIAPIYLNREMWSMIDVATAVILIVSLSKVKVAEKKGG